MHGFMNFNLYRPENVCGLIVPQEGVYHLLLNEREIFVKLIDFNFLFKILFFQSVPAGTKCYARRQGQFLFYFLILFATVPPPRILNETQHETDSSFAWQRKKFHRFMIILFVNEFSLLNFVVMFL